MKMAQDARKLKEPDATEALSKLIASTACTLPTQGQLALEYARMCIAVHPVDARSKRPLTLHGKDDATTDPAVIFEWWTRWPQALVSAPTGDVPGFWVLDQDRGGEGALNELLRLLQCDTIGDLTPAWAETAGGGRHLYFFCEPGTSPRTRSSDIAPKIDTRGIGGSIILPGNALPDGRRYQWRGAASTTVVDGSAAPPLLLHLATFNTKEREHIRRTPGLAERLRKSHPRQWVPIVTSWRDAEAEKLAARVPKEPSGDGMRRQALHDLDAAADEYASMTDGRRTQLFAIACRVAKYVVHGVLSEIEFRNAFIAAAQRNGALAKYLAPWAVKTLRSALIAAQSDRLPPLARAFRSEGGSHG